jgi:hypothetical protein
LVDVTGEAYAYAGDDPVNGSDPSGLCWSGFGAVCDAIHEAAHVNDNLGTELSSHWRGLAKIAITAAVVVAGSACVAATAGVCGAVAFSLGGIELSGGAIAVGTALGAGTGAADYAIDGRRHTVGGYLSAAGFGAARDAVFFGLPEEAIFGGLGEGSHAAQNGFCQSLANLPGYLKSVFK